MNVVIGGGAAGMIAAGVMASRGMKTVLLERNDRLGKKLYITGKGRCNVTNTADVPDMMEKIPGNPYFLYSALYSFDSVACMAFFEGLGVSLVTERGGRVFPASERASDIVRALGRFIKQSGAEVRLGTGAREIRPLGGGSQNRNAIVTDSGTVIECGNIIVATGGLSYPATGSTGDGYQFARAMGHKVTKLYPSLVALNASEKWIAELQGLSLKNVSISLKEKGKTVYSDFGEMLFTHNGVSGPIILSASRHVQQNQGGQTLTIDLKPALDENELDNRILRDFVKYINKSFKNCLGDLLPKTLIPVIVGLSGIDPERKANEITKIERKSFVRLLKNMELTITDTAGFDEAVVTRGGVCVDEVDPSTMESKLVKGLYFAGEVLDLDAYTGGYNLQIAFATGYLAGKSVGGKGG